MTENEHLEEMAKVLETFCGVQDKDICIADCDQCRAKALFAKGYRKVVQCKECKWLLPHKYIEGYDGNCDLSGCEVYNDDYCSRGEISNERKD